MQKFQSAPTWHSIIQNPFFMSIFLNKTGPLYFSASYIAAMILSSTFTSFSIASDFAVHSVASFTEGILNPFSINLNDKSSIALKFRIL